MQQHARHAFFFLAVLTLLSGLLGGCAGHNMLRQAEQAELVQDWDQAVLHYLELNRLYPENIAYRAALLRAKIEAGQQHFKKGKEYVDAGFPERALVELRQAVELDPTNQYAESELRKVLEALRSREKGEPAQSTIAEKKERSRGARPQPPVLNPRSNEPIDLIFTEPASVMKIYRALGKAFNINIQFDSKLRDQEISIELQDVTAQDALEILMRTVGHFYKVLDEHTIIIADDTPQNRRTYEDLVIQTFFLSNSEVKEVMTMVRSLLGTKNVAANEQLNAIIIRDSADRVKVAEQVILANDKASAEVVIDVELLQINTSRLRDLGLSLSQYQVTSQLDLGGEDVPLRLSDIEFLNANNWVLTIPSFIYSFIKNSADAQVLAQPKLRISEGKKANLTIGQKVPIPTTSFNTSNTAGSNIVPVTSFQYQDVGIKIEIEPRVHHNDEVSLSVSVEVSNIDGQVPGSGGQSQPIIGTRNIDSKIRLRDGETNFLAGLIRTDEISSERGVPGLSEIPVLGRLFSRNSTDNTRTDIVLTMTPHIIRRADITDEDLLPIWVGTEQNITFRGGSSRVESPVQGPFDGEADDAREQMQERLRQRLRSLPRGLEEGAEEEPVIDEETGEVIEPQVIDEETKPPEEPQPPAGVELAPTGGLEPPTEEEPEQKEDQ